MDPYRVAKIQERFMRLNSKIQSEQQNDEFILPDEYYRYIAGEKQIKQFSSDVVCQNDDQSSHSYSKSSRTKLAYPESGIGLLEVKAEGLSYCEIAVIVSSNMLITPFCKEGQFQAVFYTAFSNNRYFNAIPVTKIIPQPSGFSIVILEGRGIENVVGFWKINEQKLNNEQALRENNYLGIKMLTYVNTREGVGLVEKLVPSQDFKEWKAQTNQYGVCFSSPTSILLGVMNRKGFIPIYPRDIFGQNTYHENKLNCSRMDLSQQQCLWVATKKWHNLAIVDLQSNSMDVHSCRSLRSADWNHIQELNLSKNPIQFDGCYELTKVPLKNLRKLGLKNALVGNEGCRWLAAANWPQLEQLNLRINNILESGCAWLARAGWPKLKRLNLAKNKIRHQGCQNLSTASWNLEVINLKGCMVEDSGCKWLMRAKWPSLRELSLEQNKVTSIGLKWLRKANWKLLMKLFLAHNQLDRGASGLKQLSLMNCPYLYELSIDLRRCKVIDHNLLKGEFSSLSLLKYTRNRGQNYELDEQIRHFFPKCQTKVIEIDNDW